MRRKCCEWTQDDAVGRCQNPRLKDELCGGRGQASGEGSEEANGLYNVLHTHM